MYFDDAGKPCGTRKELEEFYSRCVDEGKEVTDKLTGPLPKEGKLPKACDEFPYPGYPTPKEETGERKELMPWNMSEDEYERKMVREKVEKDMGLDHPTGTKPHRKNMII